MVMPIPNHTADKKSKAMKSDFSAKPEDHNKKSSSRTPEDRTKSSKEAK
jgi:hypothetical protein